jgi:hypothetical protein
VAWTAADYGVILWGNQRHFVSFSSHDAFPLRLKRPGDVVPLFNKRICPPPKLGIEGRSCRIGQEASASYRLVPGCVGLGASRCRTLSTHHDLQTWSSCAKHSDLFSGLILRTPMKEETLFRQRASQQQSNLLSNLISAGVSFPHLIAQCLHMVTVRAVSCLLLLLSFDFLKFKLLPL